MTAAERAELAAGYAELEAAGIRRPRTRSECPPDACPWFTCRWHLGTYIEPIFGAAKLIFPDLDFDQLPETCSLRVAERASDAGEMVTLEEIARLQNVTPERVYAILKDALTKVGPELARLHAANDLVCPDPGGQP